VGQREGAQIVTLGCPTGWGRLRSGKSPGKKKNFSPTTKEGTGRGKTGGRKPQPEGGGSRKGGKSRDQRQVTKNQKITSRNIEGIRIRCQASTEGGRGGGSGSDKQMEKGGPLKK